MIADIIDIEDVVGIHAENSVREWSRIEPAALSSRTIVQVNVLSWEEEVVDVRPTCMVTIAKIACVNISRGLENCFYAAAGATIEELSTITL